MKPGGGGSAGSCAWATDELAQQVTDTATARAAERMIDILVMAAPESAMTIAGKSYLRVKARVLRCLGRRHFVPYIRSPASPSPGTM